MHVGLYFNTAHLPDWTWEAVLNGTVPLSGTDGSVLRVTREIASSSPFRVTLLTSPHRSTPGTGPVSWATVQSLSHAVGYADAEGIDVLVFNNDDRLDIDKSLEHAERTSQSCIVWCQNGPTVEAARRYVASPAVKRVICVSHPHADVYRDKSIFDKVTVIHNPVDLELYALTEPVPEKGHTVCYVGALTPDKGFHHLARAWPEVRNSFPTATLAVIGSSRLYDRDADLGPLGVAHPAYEEEYLIPQFGHSKSRARDQWGVTFEGLLPPTDICSILKRSSVGVVNPNLGGSLETFCVTAAEMQAVGVPVVGGNRKGLRETVRDGETGLLIDAPDELSAAIEYLLANPDKAHQMGMRGRDWVHQRYDTRHIAARWCTILKKIHSGIQPAPPPLNVWQSSPKTLLREAIRWLRSCTDFRS